jgi:hypothetical protein
MFRPVLPKVKDLGVLKAKDSNHCCRSYFQLILVKFLGIIPTPSFTVMV